MDHGAEKDEEMPQEMGTPAFQGEGDDPDGIDETADERGQKEREIFPDHSGQEDETAPAEHDEEREMERFGTARTENCHEDDAGENDGPLDTAKNRAGTAAPEEQPHGGEGTADEQIDGYIVKPAPETLDTGSPAEGMIKTAHEEHDYKAQSVNQGTEYAEGSIRFHQKQYKAGNTEQRADSMGDGVSHFLQDGTPGRFVLFPAVFLHRCHLLRGTVRKEYHKLLKDSRQARQEAYLKTAVPADIIILLYLLKNRIAGEESMKNKAGILILILITFLCAHALGESSACDAIGDVFRTEEMIEGFSVPVPADEALFRFRRGDGHYMTCRSTDGTALNRIYIDYYVFDPLNEFAEDWDTAEAVYASQHYETNREYQSKNIPVEGHMARICVFRGEADEGDQSIGILHYVRNNRMLQIRVYSEPQFETQWEDLPKVTLDDMKKLAGMVSYDPGRASATAEDGVLDVAVRDGTGTLSAGKTIRMSAVFAKADKVNKEAKNNSVKWTVKDPETGKAPEGITINQKGELSADKRIADPVTVTVRAESAVYHTTAEMPVTVIPAMTGLTTEPAEVMLYTGTKSAVMIRAIPAPKTVPPAGITWSVAQKGIVEIQDGPEEGTVSVLPLKAGLAVITAKEPGGKTARVNVNVMQSVEDITLSVNGTAVPGGQVTVKAVILPKTLWDRKLTWSLDVDQGIATIDRGTIRISRSAPAGSVITVTCTAMDAAEPVVKTIEIEVTKK